MKFYQLDSQRKCLSFINWIQNIYDKYVLWQHYYWFIDHVNSQFFVLCQRKRKKCRIGVKLMQNNFFFISGKLKPKPLSWILFIYRFHWNSYCYMRYSQIEDILADSMLKIHQCSRICEFNVFTNIDVYLLASIFIIIIITIIITIFSSSSSNSSSLLLWLLLLF